MVMVFSQSPSWSDDHEAYRNVMSFLSPSLPPHSLFLLPSLSLFLSLSLSLSLQSSLPLSPSSFLSLSPTPAEMRQGSNCYMNTTTSYNLLLSDLFILPWNTASHSYGMYVFTLLVASFPISILRPSSCYNFFFTFSWFGMGMGSGNEAPVSRSLSSAFCMCTNAPKSWDHAQRLIFGKFTNAWMSKHCNYLYLIGAWGFQDG